MKSLGAVWPALFFAFGACVSDDIVETQFDARAGLVTVQIGGDGFVLCDGRRLPLEALVLELRQQTRRMDPADLLRYVVRVRLGEVADGEGASNQKQARARLLDELEIMGVRQIVYL